MDVMNNSQEDYQIRTSGRIIPMMSERLYQDNLKAIEELVANAYDADATKVYVIIDFDEDAVIVEDNGEGMDRNGLIIFFDLGSSTKEERPVTKKGRKKIGSFGIGKIASNKVGGKVTIYTVKNGEVRKVSFNFEDLEEIDKLENYKISGEVADSSEVDLWDFPVFEDQDPKSAHGTMVVLEGLKVDEENFNPNKIYQRLRRKMPLRPDFNVYVNKQKVAESRIDNPEKVFEIDEDVNGLGHIEGKLIYTSSSLSERAGIWVRVHGRVVNNEGDWLNIRSNIKAALAPRIYGDIKADCLADEIRLDREGFDRSSEKWKIFRDYMRFVVKNRVLTYWRERQREKELKEFDETADRAAEDITKIIKDEDFNFLTKPIRKGGDFDKKGKNKVTKGKSSFEDVKDSIIDFTEKEEKSDGKKKSSSSTHPKTGTSGKKTTVSTKSKRNIVIINEVEFKLKAYRGGKKGPECEFYSPEKLVLINAEHPYFVLSHRESFDSLKSSMRRAVLLKLAIAKVVEHGGNSYSDALGYYDKLLRKADALLTLEDYEDLGFEAH